MSGRELALMLQDLAPGLKVLYMSGYTDEEIATRGLVNAAHVLLHKPFGAEALARRVREVLDTPVPKGRVSDPQSRKPERTEPQP
jgi:DNA-binding response OmpR family regulator